MKTIVTIDRIEECFAVIELDADNFITVPLKYLPTGVKEGERIVICFDEMEKENK